jgi:hypothetical protein
MITILRSGSTLDLPLLLELLAVWQCVQDPELFLGHYAHWCLGYWYALILLPRILDSVVAINLGLFEALAEEDFQVAELAKRLNCNERGLRMFE